MEYNCSPSYENETSLTLFQRVAYTPLFIAGLPLNISALWFFSRIRHWTSTHVYMFNLMLADFLLLLFLPFRILETFCPMKPSDFCTFLICVHYGNMYVSMFTITAISFHRFMSIKFPMMIKAFQPKRKTMAYVVCIFIWTLVVAVCTGFSGNLRKKMLWKCYERNPQYSLQLSFFLVLEIVGYLLPVVVLVTCSIQAVCTILKSTEGEDSQQRFENKDVIQRKRIVNIITANMIVFLVCFTPIHVAHLLKYLFPYKSGEVTFSHAFYEICEWIATTNCCLDSVGYYLLLKKGSKAKSPEHS